MVQGEGDLKENLGTRRIPKLRMANFPSADEIVRDVILNTPRSEKAVDIMLMGDCGSELNIVWDEEHGRIWFGRKSLLLKWQPYCTQLIS
jgi:hypothetical protein